MNVICITLATYNGANYLREQLDSLINQRVPTGWQLIILIADDGSTDETCAIIENYVHKAPVDIKFLEDAGKKLGPARMFERIAAYASSFSPQILMFCDQDDVWLEDKIERTIEKLGAKKEPSLYVGTAWITNDNLKIIGKLPRREMAPSFPSILLSNQNPGMTIAFNSKALRVWLENKTNDFLMHDWWAQLVILANQYTILFDNQPTVMYRQHNKNTIGIHRSWKSRWKMFQKNGIGHFEMRSKQARVVLSISKDERICFYSKLVSDLIVPNFQSLKSMCKILFSSEFFENRRGLEKLDARLSLVLLFGTFRLSRRFNR